MSLLALRDHLLDHLLQQLLHRHRRLLQRHELTPHRLKEKKKLIHDLILQFNLFNSQYLGVAARLPEAEERVEEGGEGVAVHGGEAHGPVGEVPQLGHGVPAGREERTI